MDLSPGLSAHHKRPSWGSVPEIAQLPACLTASCCNQNFAAPSELRSILHSYAATLRATQCSSVVLQHSCVGCCLHCIPY